MAMASLANDPGGHRRVLFNALDGKRRAIRLGKMSKDAAQLFRLQVAKLVSAKGCGEPPSDETRRWVERLGDEMHGKLSSAGLIDHRENLLIGPWLQKYLDNRKADPKCKASSLRKLEQTAVKLLGFFTGGMHLRKITENDADDWRSSLVACGSLSEATVKIHSGNAKTIFAQALRRSLISRNPFARLVSGSTPREDARRIPHDDVLKVLNACPNTEWKLWIALPYFATLRVPSETQELTFGQIDFARGRLLNVHRPKLERFGFGIQTLPVVPPLMRLLELKFAEVRAGTQRVLRLRKTGYVVDELGKFIDAAGVDRWPDLFQTLRASGEAWHVANGVDPNLAAMIAGHTWATSRRCYVRDVPDEILDHISGYSGQAAQKAAQQGGERTGISRNPDVSVPVENGISRREMATCGVSVKDGEMGDEGFEPPTPSV
jgi:integrase